MGGKEIYIKVTKDGPYVVYGIPKLIEQMIVIDEEGTSVRYTDGEVYKIGDSCALCRCGRSTNAPFCSGAHKGFDGTETASFELLIDGAESIKGPDLTMLDNQKYCAYARFCDANGRVWNIVRDGGNTDDAIEGACNCPAGRLIVLDGNGNPIEKEYELAISPLEDSGLKLSGPLWVKGGIRVESESGRSYEVRNRQTLCRCGYSDNKPFCNGAHASVKYKAKK